MNHSEIGFYGPLGKAHRTALEAVPTTQRQSHLRAIVTTFFLDGCPRKKPYKSGERGVMGMDSEMRRVKLAEVQRFTGSGTKLEVLDVTEMTWMRPDGHPAPYMNTFPFADGMKDRVQNDCVHWCLPGVVDTWNEILLQMMKKWDETS